MIRCQHYGWHPIVDVRGWMDDETWHPTGIGWRSSKWWANESGWSRLLGMALIHTWIRLLISHFTFYGRGGMEEEWSMWMINHTISNTFILEVVFRDSPSKCMGKDNLGWMKDVSSFATLMRCDETCLPTPSLWPHSFKLLEANYEQSIGKLQKEVPWSLVLPRHRGPASFMREGSLNKVNNAHY